MQVNLWDRVGTGVWAVWFEPCKTELAITSRNSTFPGRLLHVEQPFTKTLAFPEYAHLADMHSLTTKDTRTHTSITHNTRTHIHQLCLRHFCLDTLSIAKHTQFSDGIRWFCAFCEHCFVHRARPARITCTTDIQLTFRRVNSKISFESSACFNF